MKFGGDKGHGSFKFNMQLCNTDHPNSQKRNVLVSMCLAGDCSTNLHVCLDMYVGTAHIEKTREGGANPHRRRKKNLEEDKVQRAHDNVD